MSTQNDALSSASAASDAGSSRVVRESQRQSVYALTDNSLGEISGGVVPVIPPDRRARDGGRIAAERSVVMGEFPRETEF